jgi:hypothetical protein
MSRTEDLREWERSRRAEIGIDAISYALAGLVGVSIGYGLLPADVQRFYLVGAVSLVGVMILLIVWLRTWGAYIERRLSEIEARLVNERPIYYTSADIASFDENPLYTRLDAIEDAIRDRRGR